MRKTSLFPTRHLLLSLLFTLTGFLGFSQATVTTDKPDYQPGEYVIITGTGWTPGETVTLHFEESPTLCTNGHNRYTVADNNGHIYYDQFLIEQRHFGVSFVLTATGQTSQLTAETTFTDGGYQIGANGLPATTSVAVSYTVSGNAPAGGAFNLTFITPGTVGDVANNRTLTLNSFTPSFVPSTSINYTILNYTSKVGSSVATTSKSNSFLLGGSGASNAILIHANYGALVVSPISPTSYGGSVNLSATFYSNYPGTVIPGKTILFKIGTTFVGSASTNSSGVATVNVNLGTTSVGDHTVTASFTEDSDYFSASGTGTLSITKANAVINISGYSGTYDASSHGATGTATGVNGEDLSASLNFGSSFINVPGGTANWTFSGGTNYNNASGSVNIEISPFGITGNFTVPASKVYDNTSAANVLTRTLNNVFAGDDVSLVGGTATYDDENVGDDKPVTLTGATLSGAQSGNYSLSSVNNTSADITQLGITGNFTVPASKVYDNTNAASVLTRTLNNVFAGDDVSLVGGTATYDDENVADDKLVTLTGATLSGAQSGNYSLSSVNNTSADITQLGITGSFTVPASKVYDNTNAASVLTRTLNNVFAGDDVSLVGGTATYDDENAGDDKPVTLTGATLSGAQSGNYSLTSVNNTSADIAQLGITGNFTVPASKVYDNTSAANVLTRTLNNVFAGDDVSLVGGTATYDDENVGDDKPVTLTGATLSGAQSGNYSLTSVNNTSADITQLGITGNFTVPASKVYDNTNAASVLTRTLNNVFAGDDVSLVGGTATYDDENVGDDKPVTLTGATLSGAQSGNYSLTSVNNTSADIAQLGITGNFTVPASKVYDNTNAANVLTRTLNNVFAGDDVSLVGGTATYDDENVGDDKPVTLTGATLSGAQSGNYSLTSVNNTSADITQLGITGNFTVPASKVYDNTNAANVLTRTLNNVFAGDDVSLVGGTATYDDENVGDDKPVTLTGASLSGAQSGNYSLTSVNNTSADITQLGITGNFTVPASKVYDNTNAANVLTRTLNNVFAGDDVSLVGGTATYDDENVGDDKPVTLTGASLSGAQSGNYSLLTVNKTSADITQLSITGNFTVPASKVYDNTNAANVLTRTLNNVFAGDDVSLVGGTATYDDENVGDDKPVTLTGATLSGAQSGNYSLLLVNNTSADITQLGITGNFTVPASKVYDNTNAANVLTRTLNNIFAGDDVSLVGGTATYDDENVGDDKPVTLTGAALSGAQSGNYSLTSVNNTSADITQLGITGNFTVPASKVYDNTNAANVLTRTLNNVFAGDDVSLVGGTATYDDENVGDDKPVTLTGASLSGAQSGNYSLLSVNNTSADITQLSITGNFTVPASKVYDNTNAAHVLTRTLNNLFAGDDVSLVGGTATYDDENVGDDKPVTLTGATLSGAQSGNYSLTSVNNTSADITQLGITGNFTVPASKPFDNTNAATVLTRTLNSVYAGDDVELSGGTANYASINVGTGITVSLTGAVLSGAQAGNYSLLSVSDTYADITPAETSVSVASLNVQYSDQVTLIASVTSATAQSVLNNTGGTVLFKLKKGSDPAIVLGTSAYPGDWSIVSGIATVTKTFTILQAPGAYSIIAVFSPNSTNIGGITNNTAGTLTVNREDATADYTGQDFASTGTASATSVKVRLSAVITDVNDGFRGDITNAYVRFILTPTVGSNVITTGYAQVQLPGLGSDPTVGTVAIDQVIDIGSDNSRTYDVLLEIGGPNGYYTGSALFPGALTVSKSLNDFVTGGGYVKHHSPVSNSAGRYASDPGTKTNYGFNVKYNKNKSNLQGNVNIGFRKGGVVYQVKGIIGGSNGTLSVNVSNTNERKAILISKVNITNTLTGLAIPESNLTMEMRMTDRGEPGTADSWSIEIKQSNGTLIYSSNWLSTNKTAEATIAGGNIQVRSGNLSRSISNITGNATEMTGRDADPTPVIVQPLTVAVGPNPSIHDFTLYLKHGNQEDIHVDVLDILGRSIKRYKVTGNNNLRFGSDLIPGMYILDIRQGDVQKKIRIIKQ